jgi:hypothetical protein
MPMRDASLFPPLPRREFLRISATAVAGIAATSLVSPSSLFAAPSTLPLLSIGYAPSIPGAGQAVALISAADILSSDPLLIGRGALVNVAGFERTDRYADDTGGVQLDAVFPILSRTPEHYPRFNAWSMNGRQQFVSYGGTISFKMPVTATDGVVFIVRRLRADEKSPDEKSLPVPGEHSRVQLAVNSGGDAKLARGVYVLAFREGNADSAPNWSRLAVSNKGGFMTVPGIATSYVVLTIDYATSEK